MVGVIKYGCGNIYSVIMSVKHIGEEVLLIEKGDKSIEKVNFLILPGVGSFDAGMEYLEKKDLSDKIKLYIGKGMPFLGICLGLQLLFEKSEEGNKKGLEILKGEVKKFRDYDLKIPHVGWNKVEIVKKSSIFNKISSGSYFYFAHSYFVVPEENVVYGKTEYGSIFPSIIIKDNVVGVQFHPEKSGKLGLLFLKNFMEGKWLQ